MSEHELAPKVEYDPLSMHLTVEGPCRFGVLLGNDGSVRLFWRHRGEGQIYEPEVQHVRFGDGKWTACDPPGPLARTDIETAYDVIAVSA